MVNRHALERFLFRFDKEPRLQASLKEQSEEAFDSFGLTAEERLVLIQRDVATLYEWGVHPLLIRNFCGTVGVRYVAAYAQRGLT
jgi:hypothetical protein